MASGQNHPRLAAGGGEALQRFIRRRQDLNERLESAKLEIDAWIEGESLPPSMAALAKLEALLTTRRDILSEFIDCDEEFMRFLLQMRQKLSEAG